MAQSRLSTVFDDALIEHLSGSVTVFRPGPDYDLSALGREQVTIQHSFKPSMTFWDERGYKTVRSAPDADTSVVVVPRSKTLAKAMVAEAARRSKFVIVDGQKTDGVDSLFKECRKRLGDVPSLPKAHGRIFWFHADEIFADWETGGPVLGAHGFYTQPGVYAEGAVDRGSELLAANLPKKLPARVADFGAGWGFLSRAILDVQGVESLHLIEAEDLSLECAKLNVTDARARFEWEDVSRFSASAPFDAIVMNPPFHQSRAAEPDLGRRFIQAASRALSPGGQLWMVANRHLPYESQLSDSFRNVSEFGGNASFKLFHATRPVRKP